MKYLYAVMKNPMPVDIGPPEGEETLHTIACGRLSAVAGETALPPRPTEARIQLHDAIVRRLSEADAVLPARFGQCFADGSTLRESILRHEHRLLAALEKVGGCRQMTLRVFGCADPEPSRATGLHTATSGTAYLSAKRRALAKAHAIPEAETLLEALRPLARDERARRHGTPPLLGSVYHLVPIEDLEAYAKEAACGSRTSGDVRVLVTGPRPPYSFVPAAFPDA